MNLSEEEKMPQFNTTSV